MNHKADNLNEIYSISKLLTCKKIKLSTWSNAMNFELLVLYTSNEDFICYNFNSNCPNVKIIPWFRDPLHTPVSIDLSPSSSFLLVLSKICNLYILPLHSIFNSNNTDNLFIKNNDLIIHSFPFLPKNLKPCSLKLKSSNSSHSLLSDTIHQSSSAVLKKSEKSLNFNVSINTSGNENFIKMKDILSSQCKVNPSVVCWWQISKNYQEVAIIGTMSGDIIFVDLMTGIKVAEASVRGRVKAFKICPNNINDNSFLLITLDNDEQYKLTLEEKNLNYSGSNNKTNFSGGNEENYHTEKPGTVVDNRVSYLPATRNRLQDLKEISIEKFILLKHKITETRSKMGAKQDVFEEVNSRILGDLPENLNSAMGSDLTLFQIPEKGNVLAGYHAYSQLLTVHSMNLDIVPLVTYKLPFETEEVILGDRIIYAICDKRTSLHVISSKLSETSEDKTCEFNFDSVISKFNFITFFQEKENNTESVLFNESENVKKYQSMLNDSQGNGETILKCYISYTQSEDDNVYKTYKLEKTKELPEIQKAENCVVVTNKGVYFVYLKSNILKIALDLILETYELEKAEKVCTIFGISLQKLLELAADIKLHSLEFPTAMALYKLSKCGLLKSIVKLACKSHCSQMLNYSVILLSNSISEMSLTERIHLSNLILMAYTQQILKNENCRALLEKFMEFLKTNLYFDEVLAVSITGQSLLFGFFHKLIIYKGLTVDGYNVLIKLIERFKNNKVLDWNLNKKDFFLCLTEPALIEALIMIASSFPVYCNYISEHVHDLDPMLLERLLKLLDPTSFYVRPIAILFRDGLPIESDDSQAVFDFGKLVELFLVILLVKLHKSKRIQENYEKKFLLPFSDFDCFYKNKTTKEEDIFELDNNLTDKIKVLKKDVKDVNFEQIKKRSNCILNCGFAHTALIRNGSLYTWGQALKGCLGQGPSMSRYSAPSPVTWLNCLKLEVSLVACGKHHTAILTNNGVYTWGCSKYGQLGLGEVSESPYPRLVIALAKETVTGLACGQFHTLAVTNKGSVFAWGWGVHGQLGIGSIDDQRYPKLIEALKEQKIVDIAAGHGHSLVLSDKGQLYSFGSSIFGQLGTGTTTKYSVPILISKINKKVITISTGYFQNLALTESNVLYTWGSSPQYLRFQAQGRKKLRIQQNQCSSNTSSSEISKSTLEKFSQKSHDKIMQENENEFKIEETHLTPSVVDTSNVTGKIIQISCGCHHSALITDSGEVYTWGRSLDGQLGNGGHHEVPIPTQICKTLKADRISCGCDFTSVQEKNTGKIFSWGSNAFGQLASPIRESATKSLDGKLVMLKSCKRIVRLMDRNAALNSIDTPKEITDIPPPSFTYQNLTKFIVSNNKTLSDLDPAYSEWSLHYVVENFRNCINLNFLLNKSLEYNNFQLTSKIFLLQNCKQSITYQLKALQNSNKYQKLRSALYKKKEKDLLKAEFFSHEPFQELDLRSVPENGYKKLPNTEKHHQDFNDKDGKERKKTQNFSINLDKSDEYNILSQEYIEDAKYILDAYINLNLREEFNGMDKSYIIESGIQFWTAENFPFKTLETFFLSRLDEIYYDLGLFFFCQQYYQSQCFQKFSTLFLFKIAIQILSFIENYKNYDDYITALLKKLKNDKIGQKLFICTKKQTSLIAKSKSINHLNAITEYLIEGRFNENYIRISHEQMIKDKTYFFSCGHHHSWDTLKEEFKIFSNDEYFKLKLMKFYNCLDVAKQVELSCPLCLGKYMKPFMNIT